MKHKITLEDRARPVKEPYRRVPSGLYDEVLKHLHGMVDIRAIGPSIALRWMWLCKSRRRRAISIFLSTCKSWTPWQSRMPTSSQEFRIPWIVYMDLFGLSCLIKEWVLAGGAWGGQLGFNHLHSEPPQVLRVWVNAMWADKWSGDVSATDGNLLGWSAIFMVHHLPRWCHHFCWDPKGAFEEVMHSTFMVARSWTDVTSMKCNFFKTRVV